MMQNHFTTILRSLVRQPLYTTMNLLCLTLGITAVLFILVYLDFELKYDRFHENASRIYRIETKSIKTHEKKIETNWSSTPANLAPYLQKDFTGVEANVRLFRFWSNDQPKLSFREHAIDEENIFAADASVFKVFSFDLTSGDPNTALVGPNKIVLSESLAYRIFGKEEPVGKILESNLVHHAPEVEGNYSLVVTGVYRDLPKNSHLTLKAMISAQTDQQLNSYYFNLFNVYSFVLLENQVTPHTIAPNLTKIYEKYLNADREPVLVSAHHKLIPLTSIHLNETGGLAYIYIFGAVALLLIVITAISYVNLAVAQANKKGLEIGIRKVLGAHKTQLSFQLLTESLFFTILSLIIGSGLLVWLIKQFNPVLGLELDARQLLQPSLLLSMVTIVLLLGILGGCYPTLFLSSFEPIKVMKAKSAGSAAIRRILVGIQFAAVIFVVASTGLVYEQLRFLSSKDLGFDKEHVFILSVPEQNDSGQWTPLKDALSQSPHVTSAGTSGFVPGAGGMRRGPVSAEGSQGQAQKFAYIGAIDYNWLATLGIKVTSGRNFSKDFPGDSLQATIINETFARNFGLKDPIGKEIRFGNQGNPNFFKVIGVIEDFHQNSLRDHIQPQMFLLRPTNILTVKIEKDLSAGIDYIEKVWVQAFPDVPFNYHFLDDQIQEAYAADEVRGKVFFLLSILTVFISFLSLFGLASYLAKQRIKEIGIRKALGADMGQIIVLMTRDFLLMAALAAVPAFIMAWSVINQWLEKFAFKISIDYLLFVIVLLFALALTFVVTGWHAVQMAKLNPAKTLKHE